MTPFSTKLEQQNRDRTVDMLNDIEESLMGYAIINGRMPCPDCPDGTVGTCNAVAAGLRNDGLEDQVGATPLQTCATDVGNLPWVELQVPENDAWSRHFTYRVSPAFSRESNTAVCGTPAIGISFELCTAGNINVYDTYVVGTTGYTPPVTVAENVPAIVISHGNDTYEPVQSAQQVENFDRDPVNPNNGVDILTAYTAANFTDTVFINSVFARDQSLNPPTQFDDLVIWISPTILMNRMVVSGKLP